MDNLLDLINAKIPTEVILFEVAKEKDTRRVTERIAELMYIVLLRELGYAEDWDIAELEIELEAEGRLQDFVELCQTLHKRDWTVVRSGAQRVARASAILHHLDPATYPSADSWSHSRREPSISVSKVVERTFELARRRRPGKALVFIIDEVGQHVARSGDKIEDLRATVEEFGKVGKNLLKARKIIAPCWIVVTSQEKLDEVVAAIDSKRVELAKLQDRFHYRVDLAPSDIREVATKRVLAKKEAAVPILKKLYNDNQGQLNAALRLERTTRKTEIGEAISSSFYPYPPHYIDLCIGIMSGIRLQPGAPRHYGGSNRTIIKQAYEMLVSDRTAMATKPVGTLVTLDKVYELVEGNLSSEKRSDIHEIGERFKDDPEDQGWALRVAKVICLLEFLRDLPRTEANIAAFLVDRGGHARPAAAGAGGGQEARRSPVPPGDRGRLEAETLPEKNWEKERENLLDPKPRERNEITRNVLREIFGEPALKTYRHKEHRNFRIGVAVEGVTLEDGDLPLTLCIADEPDDLSRKLNEVREESRQKSHENDLYWVFALTPEIDDLVAQTFASRKMVEKYDQMRAQSKINADEATCLQDEKNAVLNYESRLRDKLTEAMERGTGLFRGVARDASSLGKSLGEILKKLYGHAVPDLYPKLEMGSRPLKGTKPRTSSKPPISRHSHRSSTAASRGSGWSSRTGRSSCRIPPLTSPRRCSTTSWASTATATRNPARARRWRRSSAGSATAGTGTCSGSSWRCSSGPGRSRSPTGARSSTATKTHAAALRWSTTRRSSRPCSRRSSRSTCPRSKRAVESYEDLTGDTVDMDKAAIAEALKKFAAEEIKRVLPVEAQVKAHRLPVLNAVEEYKDTLTSIETGTADDCVTILAGGGASLKAAHDRVRKIGDCLDEKGLLVLRNARRAAGEVWNLLEAQGHTDLQPRVETLRELLSTESLFDSLSSIQAATQEILGAFRTLYEARPRRPDGAVRGGDREDQGAGGMDRRAGDDAGAGAGSAPVPLLLGAAPAGRVAGVQDLRGDVEPDGVGRGGVAGCSPRWSPDPEAHHAPRSSRGCGWLSSSRLAGDRGSGQAGGRTLAGPSLTLLSEGVKIVLE